MTHITLDRLDPQLIQRLQQRAQQNGRTLEAEITEILTSVLAPSTPEETAPQELDLATAIGRHFVDIEDFKLPEIPREPIREPPTFE